MKLVLFQITIVISLSVRLHAQNIANFIGNGSFEQFALNCTSNELKAAKYWNSIDSINNNGGGLFSYCNGSVPNQANTEYQLPRTGNVFSGTTFYYHNYLKERHYLKNRLKNNLVNGKLYCVKFYVNIMNTSSLGSDGFGIYFGNETIDTITQTIKALTFLTPQVQSPNGIPIVDTLSWTAVMGTFVANGNEKYALIGMFKPSGSMDTVLVNPNTLPLIYVDACIDDVSCIPIDLPAYAGPDKSCIAGDSVFVGREPDVEIDESCAWYKLNSNGTLSAPIDTVAGLYIKPKYLSSNTETFVVRQQLWCSGVKWDTVLVHQDFVGLPHVVLDSARTDIGVYPNPANDKLFIEHKDALAVEKISFMNYLGQLVLSINAPKKEIDVSLLPAGLYYLRVETNKGSKTFKLQKE